MNASHLNLFYAVEFIKYHIFDKFVVSVKSVCELFVSCIAKDIFFLFRYP
jgi:hypothetical protein